MREPLDCRGQSPAADNFFRQIDNGAGIRTVAVCFQIVIFVGTDKDAVAGRQGDFRVFQNKAAGTFLKAIDLIVAVAMPEKFFRVRAFLPGNGEIRALIFEQLPVIFFVCCHKHSIP